MRKGDLTGLAAFAAGIVAALAFALVADDLFWLRSVDTAGGPALRALALLLFLFLYGRYEPRLWARWLGCAEKPLRRRLVGDLGPLLVLVVLEPVWAVAGHLALVWLPVALGLRLGSVWVTRSPAARHRAGWGVAWLAALGLALVFAGTQSLWVLAAVALMALAGLPFLRDWRAWAATEAVAAASGLAGLLAFAVSGDRWLGAAGLAGWGIGRLWVYPKWLARRGYGWVMLAAIVSAALLGEAGLRASPWADALTTRHLSADVQSHDTLFWIHKDAFRGSIDFGVARVKIRGRDVPAAKTPDVTRVLCCGGSTTFGVDMPVEEAWPQLAERDLRAAGRRIELLNAGEPGYTSFQINLLLQHYLVPDYNPDGVILYIGYNDGQLTRGAYTERELYQRWRAEQAGDMRWPVQLGRRLQTSRLYNMAARGIIGTRERYRTDAAPNATPPELSRTLDEMLTYLRGRGIRVLIAAEAHQNDDEIYRQVMRETARRHGAGFVDVYQKMRRETTPAQAHTDVVHLTPLGNQRVARWIADAWQAMEPQP